MNEAIKLAGYFLVGGLIVVLSVHYGAKGNGIMAAFIAQFPSVTVLTFYLIYRQSGSQAVQGYIQGFLYTIPPWVLYVLIVYFLCEQIGVLWSVVTGVGVYMAASFLLSLLKA